MAVDPNELETRIQEVFELNREFYELGESGVIQELGPPASEDAIRAFEETLGFSLPPSYRTFLSLHDGWKGFHIDDPLLSIAEISQGEYAEEIQRIKKRSRDWGDVLLIDGLIIRAGLHSLDCCVIDMAEVDEQGEAPVVIWEYEEIEQYKDFAAMLAGQ